VWRQLTLFVRAAPAVSVQFDFYTSTNGTAITNIDYLPVTQTITFNPGQSDVGVLIPIINNGLIEGNTTVGLVLSNAIGTLLYSPSNALLTIIDTNARTRAV